MNPIAETNRNKTGRSHSTFMRHYTLFYWVKLNSLCIKAAKIWVIENGEIWEILFTDHHLHYAGYLILRILISLSNFKELFICFAITTFHAGFSLSISQKYYVRNIIAQTLRKKRLPNSILTPIHMFVLLYVYLNNYLQWKRCV